MNMILAQARAVSTLRAMLKAPTSYYSPLMSPSSSPTPIQLMKPCAPLSKLFAVSSAVDRPLVDNDRQDSYAKIFKICANAANIKRLHRAARFFQTRQRLRLFPLLCDGDHFQFNRNRRRQRCDFDG